MVMTIFPRLCPRSGPPAVRWISSSPRERKLRHFFAGEGFVETVNLPFTSDALNDLFSGLWEGPRPRCRCSIRWPRKIAPCARAWCRGCSIICGSIWRTRRQAFMPTIWEKFSVAVQPAATKNVCALAGSCMGTRAVRGLRRKNGPAVDFLECKGAVEGVLDLFGLRDSISWTALALEILHPGRAAQLRPQRLSHRGSRRASSRYL